MEVNKRNAIKQHDDEIVMIRVSSSMSLFYCEDMLSVFMEKSVLMMNCTDFICVFICFSIENICMISYIHDLEIMTKIYEKQDENIYELNKVYVRFCVCFENEIMIVLML